jgi:hypothetical protein
MLSATPHGLAITDERSATRSTLDPKSSEDSSAPEMPVACGPRAAGTMAPAFVPKTTTQEALAAQAGCHARPVACPSMAEGRSCHLRAIREQDLGRVLDFLPQMREDSAKSTRR